MLWPNNMTKEGKLKSKAFNLVLTVPKSLDSMPLMTWSMKIERLCSRSWKFRSQITVTRQRKQEKLSQNGLALKPVCQPYETHFLQRPHFLMHPKRFHKLSTMYLNKEVTFVEIVIVVIWVNNVVLEK